MREPLYPPEHIYPSEPPPPRRRKRRKSLLAELPRLWICRCRRRVHLRLGRRRLHAVEDLAGSSRLREPRQIRAAGDDAHPCAQRRADRRVRTRAAHLRADQHDSETRHRRLPVSRGPPLLRAWRRRLPGHRARRLQSRRDPRSRATTGAPRVARRSPSRSPRTSFSAASARWSASSRRRSSPSASSAPTRRTRSSSCTSTRSISASAPMASPRRASATSTRSCRISRSKRSPTSPRFPRGPTTIIRSGASKQALIRRDWIIGQMQENGYIIERGSRGREGEAAGRQPPPDRRAYLRRRLLRRGSAAHAAVAVRRGEALQRRPVGAHDARSAATAGGPPLAHGRSGAVRSQQGLARPGNEARRHRRLGQSARRRRKAARHPAVAARRGAQDGTGQSGNRVAAREAAGRLAGRQARGGRDRLR